MLRARPDCGIIAAGPGAVRRLCCPRSVRPAANRDGPAERGAAALEWIDEPMALCGETPIPTGELWRAVLRDITCANARRNGVVTVIHPSWWAPARVDVMVAAAREAVGTVHTRTRAEALVEALVDGPADGVGVGVIEIGDHLVALSGGGGIVAEPRSGDPGRVVQAVVRRAVAAHAVDRWLVDGPEEVGGATALATAVVRQLRVRGVRADPAALVPVLRRRHFTAWHLRPAATVAAAALAGGLLVVARPPTTGPSQRPVVANPGHTTVLVEGWVAVLVPDGWPAQRITDGPGSARVQLASPADPGVKLHLTQAVLPWGTRAEDADALRTAFEQADAAGGGVFADFDPHGSVAGRPAVTYRERRSGHVIDWAVVVDDTPRRAVRIAIGCQARDPEQVRPVCETAVRSARAVS